MPKRSRSTSLFVGCFHFDERSPRGPRSGSFQLVVEATSPDDAAEKCHAQLCELRETTTLFDRSMKIYFEGVVKLARSFEQPVLINWESQDAPPDPSMRLSCLLPPERTSTRPSTTAWIPAKVRSSPSSNSRRRSGDRDRRRRTDGIDHPLRIKQGATTAYYELDLAGNVRGLRGPSGTDLGRYRYGAFGQTIVDTTTIASRSAGRVVGIRRPRAAFTTSVPDSGPPKLACS